MALYCPVSGLKICSNQKWINQKVSDTFQANFWILDNSIIYSLPKGFADIKGVKNSLALNDAVANQISTIQNEYIQIEDYSFLEGSSSEARRYLTNKMDLDKQRLSLIFCNLSYPLSIAVKIRKRFITTGKMVNVVRHYQDAIKLALEFVNKPTDKLEIESKKIIDCYKNVEKYLIPIDLETNSNWNISTPEYSNKIVVVNHSILHSTSNGFIRSKHLSLINKKRSECQADLPKGSKIEYLVVDSSKLLKASRSARFQYMQSLKSWHQSFPIKMYILYGANTFLKTALKLGRAIVPFKVKIAKDIFHAFHLIHKDQLKSKFPATNEKDSKTLVDKEDIEKILTIVGRIDWQQEGLINDLEINEDNPLFFLYQSIKLIKEELDDLFRERKQLEDQLIQSRKLESIGTLTGGIAHDFNNIMQIISGSTELAMADINKNDTLYSNLKGIKDASTRATDIIKHLLNFSRKADQEFKKIDATAVINETCIFLRAVLPATIEIHKHFPKTGATIFADPIQINQLMMNICTNAAQAMEENGGKLDIKVEKSTLCEDQVNIYTDLKPGNFLKISISDTGDGIDPEIIDRIFDPYFTTKKADKGTGFGLSIVHRIVKTHNGVIKVESAPGSGATFIIYLPALEEENCSEAKVKIEIPCGKESILCIDDDKTIVDISEKMLTKLGYKVETAIHPVEALALFASDPFAFDLVITDMTMPQMDGTKLMHKLKEIRPDIPVIISTGFSSLITEEKAKIKGAAAYLAKPFLKHDISTIIRSVLDGKI